MVYDKIQHTEIRISLFLMSVTITSCQTSCMATFYLLQDQKYGKLSKHVYIEC